MNKTTFGVQNKQCLYICDKDFSKMSFWSNSATLSDVADYVSGVRSQVEKRTDPVSAGELDDLSDAADYVSGVRSQRNTLTLYKRRLKKCIKTQKTFGKMYLYIKNQI